MDGALPGSGDWDELVRIGIADAKAYEACRAKLRACQLCLERGRKAGVIQ